LCNASLQSLDLSRRDLTGADLRWADLSSTNLTGAHLARADLTGASLEGTNLQSAELSYATIEDVAAWDADFRNASLNYAKMRRSKFPQAHFDKARLSNADLEETEFEDATLISADLTGAKLKMADLSSSDLTGAELREADLESAHLSNANLTRCWFEPVSVPSSGHISDLRGVATVRFRPGGSGGLVLLRKKLEESGQRELEREVTYVIESRNTSFLLGMKSGRFRGGEYAEDSWAEWTRQLRHNPADWLNGAFRWLAFDLTTGYGLAPGRALRLLAVLFVLMTPVYATAIRLHKRPGGLTGIYRVWPANRIERGSPWEAVLQKDGTIERVHAESWLTALTLGLYFSALSTFRLGWRDLNVGSWFASAQSREYSMVAVGWPRVAAGCQSLLGVYLLAIWALTYFGRPFA
jgi:hypothetical protein